MSNNEGAVNNSNINTGNVKIRVEKINAGGIQLGGIELEGGYVITNDGLKVYVNGWESSLQMFANFVKTYCDNADRRAAESHERDMKFREERHAAELKELEARTESYRAEARAWDRRFQPTEEKSSDEA